jgi:hypothetical protein
MNIIFAFMVFYVSSDLQFKFELSKGIQLNKLNLIGIENTLRNVLYAGHCSSIYMGKYNFV